MIREIDKLRGSRKEYAEERTKWVELLSKAGGGKKDDLKFKRLYILTLIIMNRIENNFAILPCYYVPARKDGKRVRMVSNPVEINMIFYFSKFI